MINKKRRIVLLGILILSVLPLVYAGNYGAGIYGRSFYSSADTTSPTWENNKTNLTAAVVQGSSVYFNITLNDTNPDKYIFSWYNNTDWANDTVVSYTNGQEISVIKTILVNSGDINWTWYFNDTAGNSNQTDVWRVAVDTVYPAINFTDPTTNTNTYSQSWITANVTASDARLVNITIFLYNSTRLYNSTTQSTSPFFLNFTNLNDGDYYLNATACDRFQCNSTEIRNITLDTTAPTIIFKSQTTQSGNYSQTTIRVKVESLDLHLDTITAYIYNTTGLVNSTTSINSPLDFTFTNLPEGTYYLNATANDTANNINLTVTRTIELDTTAPSIVAVAPINGFNTTNPNQNFTFNATDNNSISCTLYMDKIGFIGNVSIITNTSVTSGINTTFNVSNLTNRTHSWFVTCSDPAGNSNSTTIRTLTVDQVSPTIIVKTPQQGNILGYNVYIYTEISDSLTAVDTATYYMLNASNTSQQLAKGSLNSTNNWDAVWNSSNYAGAEWNVTFKMTANDTLGNEISVNSTFTLDNVNPSIQLITPPTNTLYYNSNFSLNVIVQDFSLNYTNFSISNTSVVQLNSTSYPNNITIHTWQDLVNISGYSDGTYNATFYGLDGANNSKTVSTLFIVDKTPPNVTINSPSNNLKTNETNITFNWTATDNLVAVINCNLTINNNVEQSDISCTNGSACTYTLGGFTWADYTWNVTCWDNATNTNKPTGRAFTPNWNDDDNDNVHDSQDKLIGTENNVTQNGTTSLTITVGGESNLTTFNDSKDVLFYDNSVLVMNFTHNFSNNVLDLNNITIKINSSYLLVNLTGQLQDNKSLYITDDSFTDLCVKDAEISDISEMTAACNALDETNFSSCLGNNSGITIGSVTCTDEGSRIKIENMQYSAIRGTIEGTSSGSSSSPSSGSGSGKHPMNIYVVKECSDKPITLIIKTLNNRSLYSAEVSIFSGNNTKSKDRIQHYFLKRANSTQFTNSFGTSFELANNGTYTLLIESAGYYDIEYNFNIEECIKEIEIEMEPEEPSEILSAEPAQDNISKADGYSQGINTVQKERKKIGFVIILLTIVIGIPVFFLIFKLKKKKKWNL